MKLSNMEKTTTDISTYNAGLLAPLQLQGRRYVHPTAHVHGDYATHDALRPRQVTPG